MGRIKDRKSLLRIRIPPVNPPFLALTESLNIPRPVLRLIRKRKPIVVFSRWFADHPPERSCGWIESPSPAVLCYRIRRQFTAFAPSTLEPCGDGIYSFRFKDSLLIRFEPSSRKVRTANPSHRFFLSPKDVNLGVKHRISFRNQTQFADLIQSFQGIGVGRIAVCPDDGANRNVVLRRGVFQPVQLITGGGPCDGNIDTFGELEVRSEPLREIPYKRHRSISRAPT